MLEAHLIASTGAMSLVDVFHRFVYGFGDDGPSPQLAIETVDYDDRSMRVRVHNDGAGACRHYVVAIITERAPVAVATGFDLAPGQIRSMSLRWRPGRVPEPARLVASVHARRYQRNLALA
jgi:hypothetical protein